MLFQNDSKDRVSWAFQKSPKPPLFCQMSFKNYCFKGGNILSTLLGFPALIDRG